MRIFYLLVPLLLFGCGYGNDVVEKPYPVYPPGCNEDGCDQEPVDPGPPPGGAGTSFSEMKAIMDEYCERCHATADFIRATNEDQLRRLNKVKNRVSNGSMPPAGSPEENTFSLEDKRAIVNFF